MTIPGLSRWFAVLPMLVVLTLLTLLAMPAEARKKDEPIYKPDPIQVPAGKSVEQVRQVIRKTLFNRQWEAREVGAGHIQGKYAKTGRKSSVSVVVDIRFDSRSVRIAYKDSENMNYDAQAGTINRNYNKWVRNVEAVIRKEFGSY